MSSKKTILLKLTGEVFTAPEGKKSSAERATQVIDQMVTLRGTHSFGIVIGGGNFLCYSST